MLRTFALFLALTCTLVAADNRKEFGSIDSGNTITHYASGSQTFSTEFQIMNLEDTPIPFVMNIFNSAGDPQDIDLRDSDGNLVSTGAVYAGIVNPGGMVRLITPFATDENKQGFVTFDSPGFSDLGIQAVITSFAGGQPQFRTAIPALRRFQDFIRMPFTERNGLFSGIAWKIDANQVVTIVARRNDGSEICRKSYDVIDDTHNAFLLQTEMPCTVGNEGVLEIISDFVGITAIGLIFDDQLRMWTSMPFETCCFDQ